MLLLKEMGNGSASRQGSGEPMLVSLSMLSLTLPIATGACIGLVGKKDYFPPAVLCSIEELNGRPLEHQPCRFSHRRCQ